jgi:hypothetical protein
MKRSQAKERVIFNSAEFIGAMNAICLDVVSGRISPKAANAKIAEARTVLKMVEQQLKFGKARTAGGE